MRYNVVCDKLILFQMKNKLILFFLFLMSLTACGQSKYTAEQVERSTDPQVIANFIKYNPNHPKTPAFKQKLYAIVNGGDPATAKPKVAPLTTEKLKTEVKKDVQAGKVNAKTQQTADVLNHLFSNDPNRKEAYLQIQNKSKCNMVVKISGKKFYNLDVKARGQSYILVDKGTYTLTTNVCDAKYSSVKNINKDMYVVLNSK